ncbi:unnamed protein product [Phaedon cochleariae]|uniref:Protein SERAC1 n=1 Tax=Phaedon cochleariae TaxID=80249 RepID=A0A9P0GQ63_PHACE|nr:unnamed protein product [Phaedon cochleariae]
MTSNAVNPHLTKFKRHVLFLISTIIAIINSRIDYLKIKFAVLLTTMEVISSTWTRFKQNIEEQRYEIPDKVVGSTVYNEPEKVLVDVIFIHGLDGAMNSSWRQGTWDEDEHQKNIFSDLWKKSRRKKTRKNIEVNNISGCWPIDWIPQDCQGARVISLDYITGWLWCPPFIKEREGNNLITRSDEMIQELIKLGVGKRPIVWVGHSKGGLYIKQIIVNAWESRIKEVERIFRQSRTIAWYGVPHRGSSLSHYTLPLLRRSVPLSETERNCDFLQNLHRTFLQIIEKENVEIEISSFIETKCTLVMPFVYWQVIPIESAEPNIGRKYLVPVDHVDICKPRGKNCYLYVGLSESIKKLAGQKELYQNV